MDKDTLRKVQLTQLEIYKQVFEIAESNQIAVYLCAGSLLGAVRHKGFIPWDDDLDLMVPRADYDRLMICLSKELPSQYWLQTYDTDPQYWQGFAKIRKKGTLYKEKDLKALPDSKCGVWIDIFPLDTAPKNRGIRLGIRKYIIQTVGFALRIKELHKKRTEYSRRDIPILWLWSLFSSKRLRKIQLYFMKCSKERRGKYYVNFVGTYRVQKESYLREWFSETERLPFEDMQCSVPGGYKQILTQLYGDYMTPPPPEKRNGHNMDDGYPVRL